MMTISFAANDPMVSLFKFQSQMAAQGNVDAMMKLGEMYEQGVGTKRDLNKSLEMYKQAQAKGHKQASTAIRRIDKVKKQGARNLTLERQKKAAREKAARQQAAREKAARQQAAKDKAVRQKAAREKAARQQAAREKAARQKAAKDKAARQQAAREKAAREKAAKDKAIRAQAVREEAAREQAEQAAKLKSDAKKQKDKEGFTSNPCNSPAGRFMATCRKHQ